MEKPIISVSGLRGIIGQSLIPANAAEYATCFASQIPAGPIIVTRDGRTTGTMLADAICAALQAMGRDVLYGDVAATPTTGVLVRHLKASGAIQISASHNPPEYNGIKLFGADGRVISADVGQNVIAAMAHPICWAKFDQVGTRKSIADTTSQHLQLVLATVDVEAIRARQFRVVLDSNHGAGSLLGQRLLSELQVDVTILGAQPDGHFAHPPEPTAENLHAIAAASVANNVDAVFCQDPDADRLAIIDETGKYIGEEYTLAITLQNRLERSPGPIVINCSTSRMSIDLAEKYGCPCFLSAVGEANVCDEMHRVSAVFGGEGSGGPIDPRVGYVRDSFVAMAQVLNRMALTKKSISELVNDLPRYTIHKSKSTINRERLADIYTKLETCFADAKKSKRDGLRLDWPNRWLLVRPSNTEPIVRIICEADCPETAEKLADQARQIIESLNV